MAILLSEENPLHASPALYVVATPLGNRQDITLRALAVLKAVGTVAAEDTRHSMRLLDAHGIKPRLLALHEHNEQEGATRIIALLEAGQHVALITDAGTPAVSDPGARLVARVQDAGYAVLPVPGPCAAIAALSASGLSTPHFHFVGFLPNKTTARKAVLESLRGLNAALVFYEAPHRVLETVEDLAAVLEPVREIVFGRELTKLFEQIARMPLSEALEWIKADPNRQRGEFVILLGPAPQAEGIPPDAERVLKLLLAELPLKSAAKLAAEITGVAKNALYDYALTLKK
ncbi:16S rRNA (cytidine(1402)-2'-O)-methyltransferase [Uliginosibacterium flavum]|uniref:Ribosomal RNA small subunit methyltransferase I n=1 Tax=Uliginosibacterium flavum TaxID=1396831 RepID=A0ABV2TP69_9RHOO